MNSKRLKSVLFAALFSAGMLASCGEVIEAGKKIDESPYAAVYGNSAYLRDVKTNNASVVVELYGDTHLSSVKVGLSKKIPTTVEGTVAVDAAYLDVWNEAHKTEYELYPQSLVTLSGGGALTIDANSLFSAPLDVTIDADGSLEAGKTYAIPLAVTLDDPDVTVAGDAGHCVYLVRDMRSLPNSDKGEGAVKAFLFFETGETNPLNAFSFELENGKLLWDVVTLFSANINYNAVDGRPYLNCNQSTQDLLDNNEIYIQPLRKRGIKVLLGLLGNHDVAGLAQLSDAAARDFAAQVAECCRRYNLDGVNLDDEYSSSPDLTNPSFVTPSAAAGARLCYELKQAMPDKLVTVFEWGRLYVNNFPAAIDGADVDDYIDIAVANYGSTATMRGNMTRAKCSGRSLEFALGTGGNLNATNANALISGGYGWFMGFATDPSRYTANFNRFTGGLEVLYGSKLKSPTLFYKRGDPTPYVYPDDL